MLIFSMSTACSSIEFWILRTCGVIMSWWYFIICVPWCLFIRDFFLSSMIELRLSMTSLRIWGFLKSMTLIRLWVLSEFYLGLFSSVKKSDVWCIWLLTRLGIDGGSLWLGLVNFLDYTSRFGLKRICCRGCESNMPHTPSLIGFYYWNISSSSFD